MLAVAGCFLLKLVASFRKGSLQRSIDVFGPIIPCYRLEYQSHVWPNRPFPMDNTEFQLSYWSLPLDNSVFQLILWTFQQFESFPCDSQLTIYIPKLILQSFPVDNTKVCIDQVVYIHRSSQISRSSSIYRSNTRHRTSPIYRSSPI